VVFGGQSSLLNKARFGARTLMLPPSMTSTAKLSLCVELEQLAIIAAFHYA
jgi:hypothetical protein